MEQASRSGLLQMTLSAFFFSVMSLLVRIAGARLHSPQVVFMRGVVAMALGGLMLRRAGLAPWGQRRGLLFLRGLIGFGAVSCFYWSLVHLPLAEATVLQYTNPVFTAILAAVFLGEPIRRRELLSIGLGLLGVLLVADPGAFRSGAMSLEVRPIEVAVALTGALLSAAAYVTVRHASRSDPALVVVFWFSLVSLPLSVPGAYAVWIWPTPWEWAVLIGVGVANQAAQLAMTRGLHLEPAGRATAMSYLQVVFAMAWGALLGERLTATTLAGAALIGAGVLLLAFRLGRAPRPSTARHSSR